MGWNDFSDADGFALSMIAILVLALGAVLSILISVLRGSRRREDPVDRLIAEIEDEPEKPRLAARTETSPPDQEPWARDGDWGKG